ncbi:DUF1822 family protein [Oscillatoria salina]|uniref:DUF1822 family protein n=1 Tax=Oscillatoria salina TaxID=331517 RepID=UPI0013BE128A|nr:DUF1822 family protein [Oscillatoria salina]MBZ8179664.1 DUF1822 family protein [Oscillatoria salina IIICB1]NET89261.1 DUF1822 family protein [Kamptonema sp. SIO1D9]
MTFNSASLAFANPTQVWLELSSTDLDRAWEQSQAFSTTARRWNAYLNRLCLNTVLPWLQQEYDRHARVFPHLAALPSFWEVVNGVAIAHLSPPQTRIALPGPRLILIPSEAIDCTEIQVPQEWVDIPSWIGDYYLAVQVNPDDGWVKIWAYCTHSQLKQKANYDRHSRCYCLKEEDAIADLNVLWVARQVCPDEPTRVSIPPLPNLSLERANALIQRLSSPNILLPRLEIPFPTWGALLEHSGYRQRLYQQRLGLNEQWSVVDWLQKRISQIAQELGWQKIQMQPSLAQARGETETPQPILSKELVIAGQAYELRVIPKADISQGIWRFELSSNKIGDRIPGGFKLRLLTEDLQPFEDNEDIAETAVDLLYIEVALEPGEGIVWEIEPHPENCDREILRF